MPSKDRLLPTENIQKTVVRCKNSSMLVKKSKYFRITVPNARMPPKTYFS